MAGRATHSSNDSRAPTLEDREQIRLWSQRARHAYDSVVKRLKRTEAVLRVKQTQNEELTEALTETTERYQSRIEELEAKQTQLEGDLESMNKNIRDRERSLQHENENLRALARTYMDEVRLVREMNAQLESDRVCHRCRGVQRESNPMLVSRPLHSSYRPDTLGDLLPSDPYSIHPLSNSLPLVLESSFPPGRPPEASPQQAFLGHPLLLSSQPPGGTGHPPGVSTVPAGPTGTRPAMAPPASVQHYASPMDASRPTHHLVPVSLYPQATTQPPMTQINPPIGPEEYYFVTAEPPPLLASAMGTLESSGRNPYHPAYPLPASHPSHAGPHPPHAPSYFDGSGLRVPVPGTPLPSNPTTPPTSTHLLGPLTASSSTVKSSGHISRGQSAKLLLHGAETSLMTLQPNENRDPASIG